MIIHHDDGIKAWLIVYLFDSYLSVIDLYIVHITLWSLIAIYGQKFDLSP